MRSPGLQLHLPAPPPPPEGGFGVAVGIGFGGLALAAEIFCALADSAAVADGVALAVAGAPASSAADAAEAAFEPATASGWSWSGIHLLQPAASAATITTIERRWSMRAIVAAPRGARPISSGEHAA